MMADLKVGTTQAHASQYVVLTFRSVVLTLQYVVLTFRSAESDK